MNDQDYIKAAVELADGWTHDGDDVQTPDGDILGDCVGIGDKMPQTYLDALAAQLVRQVEEREQQSVWVFTDHSVVDFWVGGAAENRGYAEGPDRTMNTIKAIVDSGVLESSDD